MKIYKQPISPGTNHIDHCQEVLSVGVQNNKPFAWYIHNPDAKGKFLHVIMTGEEFDTWDLKFVGTFQIEVGITIVGHVFVQ